MIIPGITWKKSIFTRTILTLLCVMIPIYIMGFLIYTKGVDSIRNEIINSNLSQLSFMQANLEDEVKRIKSLQYRCLNDRDLLDLSNKSEAMTEFEKTITILRLERTLYSIKNSSKYIKDVKAYIPAINTEISALGIANRMDKRKYDKFRSLNMISPSQVFIINGQMILTSNKWINKKPNLDESPLLILVELSNTELQNDLKNFIDYRTSGYIIYDSVQNFSIMEGYDPLLFMKAGYDISKDDDLLIKKSLIYKINGKNYLLVCKKSNYFNMIFFKYVAENDVLNKVNDYRIWLGIFSVISLVIIIIVPLSFYRYIHMPLTIMVKAFYRVENGEMNVSVDIEKSNEFGYLYRSFNNMVKNLGNLIDQLYKQTIFAQKAELKQLQSQINPHFLYNSFFNISTFIRTQDYENAETFTQKLGEYFQYVTRNSVDEVELLREVEHARVYTTIQGTRFGKRIKIIFNDLPENLENIYVPRLILQPIIENSFEHGFRDKIEKGLLCISFNRVDSNELNFLVEDNGYVDEEKMSLLRQYFQSYEENMEITGLVNIHRRLQLKFGKDSGIEIFRSELGGMGVLVRIRHGGE